jgi:hypothetical protein
VACPGPNAARVAHLDPRRPLRGPDGAPLDARLENLSIVGLRARVPQPLPPGTRCSVELRASGVSIEARGSVLRAQGDVLAVRFEKLPYESYERLRSFLLSHADDPAVIADESDWGTGRAELRGEHCEAAISRARLCGRSHLGGCFLGP